MVVVAFIVFVFWAVFGLIFWIPLMLRVYSTFLGIVLFHLISGRPINHSKLLTDLKIAALFYFNGFNTIQQSFATPRNSGSVRSSFKPTTNPSYLREIIWAIVFWGVMVYPLIGYLRNSTTLSGQEKSLKVKIAPINRQKGLTPQKGNRDLSPRKLLVGKWKHEEGIIEFYQNGVFISTDGTRLNWSIGGQILVLEGVVNRQSVKLRYQLETLEENFYQMRSLDNGKVFNAIRAR